MSPRPRGDAPKQTPADRSVVQQVPFAGPEPDYEELRKILERDYGRKFTLEEAERFGVFLIRLTKALD